jgi:CubicO group peptidase (beta-lactamase class C family)
MTKSTVGRSPVEMVRSFAMPAVLAAILLAALVASPLPEAPAQAQTERQHGRPFDDDPELHAFRTMMRKWVREFIVLDASAAIKRKGEPIRTLYYGDMSAREPGRIASLSKAITAVCIARLIDAGRLSFTTTLGAALTGMGEPTDARFRQLTIEQVLTHRAGLAREPNGSMSDDMATSFKRSLATPLKFEPGQQFAYSNIGYLTLGMVVQAVSGNAYEEQCRRAVLEPMGAKGTIDPSLQHRAPNGGWLISAVDYLKFMQVWEPDAIWLGRTSRAWIDARRAHLAGGGGEGGRVYGLGMFMAETSRGLTFWHSGWSVEGAGSFTIKFEGGLTAVVLFRGYVSRQARLALSKRVRAVFLDK